MSAYDELAAAVAAHGPFPMPTGEPQPVELTEEQIGVLAAAGNRAVNDHYHEDLCYCRSWPTSCESSGGYFMGTWDTSAFSIGLPAVLAVWEVLRNDRHAAKIAELRADAARDEDSHAAKVAEYLSTPYTDDTARRPRRFTPLEEAVQGIETAIAPLKGDERAGADMVLTYLRTLTTPDTTVPSAPLDPHHVSEEQARRIERDRPETDTAHTCNLPLSRRLDCGHCPHEVCQDCDRCPHTCRCGATPAPRDLRPGADAARRMIADRQTAEDPHDSPLHRTYETSHDLPAFPGACEACGDTDAQWCPDCAACRQGCHGGHDDNDCTHLNAPWQVAQ